MDIEFNLIDKAWIRVARFDGEVEEKSLSEVLRNAHKYKSLAGEMAAQDIAVLRCLIALIHTIYTRVDTEGIEAPSMHGEPGQRSDPHPSDRRGDDPDVNHGQKGLQMPASGTPGK